MKATEQYFPVVLFTTLYKVVLTFEPVDEILKCDHSNESYWAVLSCGADCFSVVNLGFLLKFDYRHRWNWRVKATVQNDNITLTPSAILVFMKSADLSADDRPELPAKFSRHVKTFNLLNVKSTTTKKENGKHLL